MLFITLKFAAARRHGSSELRAAIGKPEQMVPFLQCFQREPQQRKALYIVFMFLRALEQNTIEKRVISANTKFYKYTSFSSMNSTGVCFSKILSTFLQIEAIYI